MAQLTLELLFFAEAARRTGSRREFLTIAGDSTLADLKAELFRRYPRLREMENHLLWSVDEEIAGPDTKLDSVRSVGVMPPFSGG